MKTDSLFYRLFQSFPPLLFDLIGLSPAPSSPYRFRSIELKQTAFRVDGVFTPTADSSDPLFFVEVQFQPQADFYSRLFCEIFLYLRQYRPTNPWRAVVIYPDRATDTGEQQHYLPLLHSNWVHRIYLEDLTQCPTSLSVSLVQLVVTPEATAITTARQLVTRTKAEIADRDQQQQWLDLIETIMVYKFTTLSREEIQQMLGFTEIDVKQTRFYQDVFAEGKQEGKQEGRQEEGSALVLRLLQRQLGALTPALQDEIQQLTIAEVEALAEALLDFTSLDDLTTWLQQNRKSL